MAGPSSGLDLAGRLFKATEAYNRGWRSVDDELYALCRRRNRPTDFSDTYAKVAIINRVYAAGVSRSWRATGDAEQQVASVLTAPDLAAAMQHGFEHISNADLDRRSAAEIVQLHGEITREISHRSGNVYLTSFVSKYLHFHCPSVPIYDSNAHTAVRRFAERKAAKALRAELRSVPGSVRAYSDFLAGFVTFYEQVYAETGTQPSVKEFDNLLWQSAGP